MNEYLLPLLTQVFVFQDLVAVGSIVCGHPFLLQPMENNLTTLQIHLCKFIFPFLLKIKMQI